MKIVLGLMVLVVLVLAFRHLAKRVNSYSFKFHDDPPSVDMKNLGENPKPNRNSRPKQKDI